MQGADVGVANGLIQRQHAARTEELCAGSSRWSREVLCRSGC